jgi:hypothetical protein
VEGTMNLIPLDFGLRLRYGIKSIKTTSLYLDILQLVFILICKLIRWLTREKGIFTCFL